MSPIAHSIAGNANRGHEPQFGKNRTAVRLIDLFSQIARTIWPKKTAPHFAAKADVSQRTAEFWLAGEKEISIEAARKLIQSEDGYEFLVAFMGDSEATWWRRVMLAHELGATSRAIKAQERKIAKLKAQRDQFDLDL